MKKREGRFLLKDAVSCQDPTASAVDELSMGAEHWWNYTFFSTGASTHYGFVFCSPLADYSLLAYEVS